MAVEENQTCITIEVAPQTGYVKCQHVDCDCLLLFLLTFDPYSISYSVYICMFISICDSYLLFLQLLYRKEDRTSLGALIGGILGGLTLIIIILLLLIILCKCFNMKVGTVLLC